MIDKYIITLHLLFIAIIPKIIVCPMILIIISWKYRNKLFISICNIIDPPKEGKPSLYSLIYDPRFSNRFVADVHSMRRIVNQYQFDRVNNPNNPNNDENDDEPVIQETERNGRRRIRNNHHMNSFTIFQTQPRWSQKSNKHSKHKKFSMYNNKFKRHYR